jgi:hypothetical protein
MGLPCGPARIGRFGRGGFDLLNRESTNCAITKTYPGQIYTIDNGRNASKRLGGEAIRTGHMSRVDFQDLSKKEIARIYIAGAVREAVDIERLLSLHGIDYSIEMEEFTRSGFSLMGSRYVGAAFYVVSSLAAFCRTLLKEKGFASGIQEESPE